MKLIRFPSALVLTLLCSHAHGWRRILHQCRGGSQPPSLPPGGSYRGYGDEPDLPPDLPPYGNSGYDRNGEHYPSDQQQHQGYNDPGPPPLPGGYPENDQYAQHQQVEPAVGVTEEGASWDPTAASTDGGMDLSDFDKEFILKGLARLYRKKILPLELASRYGQFHSSPLSPSDFDAPPMILLLGQYSVGKVGLEKAVFLVAVVYYTLLIGSFPSLTLT